MTADAKHDERSRSQHVRADALGGRGNVGMVRLRRVAVGGFGAVKMIGARRCMGIWNGDRQQTEL